MPKSTGTQNKNEKVTKEESVSKEKSADLLSDLKSKIPDMSGITGKIDLDGILNNIKSMIAPDEAAKAAVDPDDALGMKLVELSHLLQALSKSHAKSAKDFSKANHLLISLLKDIEAVRSKKKG